MAYSDYLPRELQEELIQISDDQTRMEFRVGDIVASALAWNAQNQRAVSAMEIYAATGAFVGKSARTVRDYHTVATFYPWSVRQEYEVLKFDHFRQAMTLGPDWKIALEWAADQVGVLGRPASVDAMIAQFSARNEGGEEEPEYPGYEDDVAVIENDEEPDANPLRKLRDALEIVRSNLELIDIYDHDREQAFEAVAVLEEIVGYATEKIQY